MDETMQPDASVSAPAAPATCQVRCITDLRPWANITEADGRVVLRPMEIDEVCTVPLLEGQALQAHRHGVMVG